MYTYGLSILVFHAHMFFASFAIVGFILLTFWALKNLQKDKLKSAAVWLLVVGILGTLVTAPLATKGWKTMHPGMHSMGMMKGGECSMSNGECPLKEMMNDNEVDQ
ncbi:MAG: hypothetical protein KC680_04185 [Candidatus Peregrinibacteria bacterium]|nr:hypothetical protein [Candidatus Peregrinibacteria bacterium]MCB9808565.1 hypothetical protein [Candidatus Peribacteria bacterium]